VPRKPTRDFFRSLLGLGPNINSFAQWRSAFPFMTNPDYWALAEKTVNLGLRRAGFPEE
jgi:hypothetical protein